MYRQTAAILATRAEPLGIEIVTADLRAGLPEGDFFGVITQLPGASGQMVDWTELVHQLGPVHHLPLAPGNCVIPRRSRPRQARAEIGGDDLMPVAGAGGQTAAFWRYTSASTASGSSGA